MPLLKEGRIVADPWLHHDGEQALADLSGPLLVSLPVWQAQREALLARNEPLGVRLASDERPDAILGDLTRLSLIALDFPKFRDGRHYSTARILRQRHGYRGELRATGEVLRDQFLFMHRCGFDAFEIRDAAAADAWYEALSEITLVYQPAADAVAPIWARRLQRRRAAE